MGMFTFTLGGGGLILIGAWEALISSSSSSSNQNQNPLLSSNSRTNPITISFISVLSFFFTINSIISLLDSIDSRDGVGSAIQLQVLAMGSLFFLYSLIGILVNFTDLIRLPSSLMNLILLFAFVEEFLMFYLQRKDTSGIENRYFDLLLVPITICVFATLIELRSSKSSGYYARLARGIGLVLQGTWILQMGLSFYTDVIAHGCSLHEKSRGNYTIRCKGHPEYHRARAIATLQFNCHLSLLVVLIAGFYSLISKNNGNSSSRSRNGQRGDFTRYTPLRAEMQMQQLGDDESRFTLDSDGDEEVNGDGEVIEEEIEIVAKVKGDYNDTKNVGANGHGGMHH